MKDYLQRLIVDALKSRRRVERHEEELANAQQARRALVARRDSGDASVTEAHMRQADGRLRAARARFTFAYNERCEVNERLVTEFLRSIGVDENDENLESTLVAALEAVSVGKERAS